MVPEYVYYETYEVLLMECLPMLAAQRSSINAITTNINNSLFT